MEHELDHAIVPRLDLDEDENESLLDGGQVPYISSRTRNCAVFSLVGVLVATVIVATPSTAVPSKANWNAVIARVEKNGTGTASGKCKHHYQHTIIGRLLGRRHPCDEHGNTNKAGIAASPRHEQTYGPWMCFHYSGDIDEHICKQGRVIGNNSYKFTRGDGTCGNCWCCFRQVITARTSTSATTTSVTAQDDDGRKDGHAPSKHLHSKHRSADTSREPTRDDHSCEHYGCVSFERSHACQCNSLCRHHHNCCPDYSDTCEEKAHSCHVFGLVDFTPWNSCQCNTLCHHYHNCCEDYDAEVKQQSGRKHQVDLDQSDIKENERSHYDQQNDAERRKKLRGDMVKKRHDKININKCATSSNRTLSHSVSLPAPTTEISSYVLNYDGNNPLRIRADPKRDNNFFLIIGDWGRAVMPGSCQLAVARLMKRYIADQKAKGKTLLFIGAVGDNFYWSGVRPAAWTSQWANPYGSNDPKSPLYNVPWLAVLGNHDYGNTDPYLACPGVKPMYAINGQAYAGRQLNADRNPWRPDAILDRFPKITKRLRERHWRLKANRDAVGHEESFSFIKREDGTYSIKTFHGNYVVAFRDGSVKASSGYRGSRQHFVQIHHDDGDSFSLKSHHGKYVVAEEDGTIRANGEKMSKRTMFRSVNLPLMSNGTVWLQTSNGKYVVAEDHAADDCDVLRGDAASASDVNTTSFWLPDYNYHYSIPEADVEVIGLDTNFASVDILGGDSTGNHQCLYLCRGKGVVQSFLNAVAAAGRRLLVERAGSNTASTVVILQHYPGMCQREIFVGALPAARRGLVQVLCAYGHLHDQRCDGRSDSGNCDMVLTGGGGGCCEPEVDMAGFTAVHLTDSGGFLTDMESPDVRMPAGSCAWDSATD